MTQLEQSAAEPVGHARSLSARPADGPALDGRRRDDSASTTLREAIETVGRAGASSSVLAIDTVHRLVRTMSAWIQTLEARRGELASEISARERDLENLEWQIEQERQNAEGVAIAARGWANEIERQVQDRKSELQAEADALDAQLRAISSSLEELPLLPSGSATDSARVIAAAGSTGDGGCASIADVIEPESSAGPGSGTDVNPSLETWGNQQR